jgi:uncharacterized membrane protein YGL010W
MRLRSLTEWLGEYGESHRHPVNKLVHWICVPAIMWSVLALLWALPVPGASPAPFNWSLPVVVLALGYYFFLSPRLALGMLPVVAAMLGSLLLLDAAGAPIVWIAAGIFVAAWIAQFWGHQVEGRRPSFFKDVQFLLIGPLWLLAHLYRRAGIAC